MIILLKASIAAAFVTFIDIVNLSVLVYNMVTPTKTSYRPEVILLLNNVKLPDPQYISTVTIECFKGECLAIFSSNGEPATSVFQVIRRTNLETRGDVVVCGETNPRDSSLYRRQVGFCPKSVIDDTIFCVSDMLYLCAMVRGVPMCTMDSHLSMIINLFQLNKFIHRKISDLSEGYRRVAQVAIAFVGFPRIILLDEPLKNVEPYYSAVICNSVRYLSKIGCAVIIGSQSLDKCEWIGVERVAFFYQNELVSTSSLKDLLKIFRAGYVFSVELSLPEEQDREFVDCGDPLVDKRNIVRDFVLVKHNNAILFSETSLRLDFYLNPFTPNDIISLYNQLVELLPQSVRSLSFGSTTDQTRLDIYAKMSLSGRTSRRAL